MQRERLVATVLGCSLLASAVHVAVDTWLGGEGPASSEWLLPLLAATLVGVLLVEGGLVATLMVARGRSDSPLHDRLMVSNAGLVGIFLLAPIIARLGGPEDRTLSLILILGSIGTLAALLVARRLLIHGRRKSPSATSPERLSLVALWVMAATYWMLPGDSLGLDDLPGPAIFATGLLLAGITLTLLLGDIGDRASLVVSSSIGVALLVGGPLLLPEQPRLPDPARSASSSTTPVVLITIDTLRADVLDRSPSVTPNLDALRQDSLYFTRARSPSPWTKPAVASLLTGVHPLVHGATGLDGRLPDQLETLAEALRTSGYLTWALGSNPNLVASNGFEQGFERFEFYPRPHLGYSMGAAILRLLGHREDLSTRQITRTALQWLETSASAPHPLFLWVHYLDPHAPYEPPEEFLEPRQQVESIGLSLSQREAVEARRGDRFSEREKDWIRGLYEAETRMVDAAVGELMDALRDLEIYDESLLVVTSDHGEEFWDHGGFLHGHTLYEELLRVPLLVKLPRRHDRSGTLSAPVSIQSVPATVLQVVGDGGIDSPITESIPITGSSPITGSPLPLSPGDDVPQPENRFQVAYGTASYEEQIALMWGRYKLIRRLDSGTAELYDLVEDPAERLSLAGARPDLLEEGGTLLSAFLERARELRHRLGIPETTSSAVSPAIRQRLRELGYLR